MEQDKIKVQDVNDLYNIKDSDIEILEKNFINDDNVKYYEAVENDYANSKTIPISAMEYKNMIMMEFFIKRLIQSGAVKGWNRWKACIEESKDSYVRVFSLAKKMLSKKHSRMINDNN